MTDMNCPKCGALQNSGDNICTECGASMQDADKAHPAVNPYSPAYASPIYDAPPPPSSRFSVLGIGGFLGNMLVMSIPLAGLIVAIIWACGDCKNQNRRNHARAWLILQAVLTVLSVLSAIFAAPMLDQFLKSLSGLLP